MKIKTIAHIVALAFVGTANAETTTSLPAVTVYGSPIIEDNRVDKFSNTSTVVSEAQLRDQNAVDLESALRRTPGVQISRINPVGSFGGDSANGAVFIHGQGSSRPGSEIKTYIDGVPFYEGVWNHPLLDLLPLNGMQSITVYKGPQPQINGNNFASINLATKRATEEGTKGSARVSAGSFGTFIEQADLLGRSGDLDYMLAQGYARSDGHRPNASGELKNVMGRVGYHLNGNWSIGASLLYTDNTARDPGSVLVAPAAVAPRYDTKGTMLTASLSHQHGDWHGNFRLFSNSIEGNWLNQPGFVVDTFSSSDMKGLRWLEEFSPWDGGTAVVGLDYDSSSGNLRNNLIIPPQTNFDTPTFVLTSPYAALSQRIVMSKDWLLVPSVGVRSYHHSDFASRTAPHAGVSLVSDTVTVFANTSRGVNYPGLDVTSLTSVLPLPLGQTWKQLSAEELNHVEMGVKLTPSTSTTVDLTVFEDKVTNRYIVGFPPDVPSPQFTNLGNYRMRGTEFAVKQDVDSDWSIFAGLTLLNSSLETLPYAPSRALSLGANGQIGPVRIAVDSQYQSDIWALPQSRVGGGPNTQRVGSFAVTNARMSYPLPQLGKKGEVFLAAENLFGRNYEFQPGYPMPGRSGQVGISASF